MKDLVEIVILIGVFVWGFWVGNMGEGDKWEKRVSSGEIIVLEAGVLGEAEFSCQMVEQ